MSAEIIEIINVVLPVFLIAFLGYLFGKWKKIDLSALNDFVIYLATPALILSSLYEEKIDINIAGIVFVSTLIIIGVLSIIGYFSLRGLKLPIKVYLPPVLFANTGNMGLPLILFAFGETGFYIGILYMVSTTVIHYTYGILILNYDTSPFEIFKLPLVYSAIAGVLLGVSQVHVPTSLFRAVDLLGEASIPTMIFALGYKLSEVRLMSVGSSFLAGGMRVLIGFALGLFVVWLFKLEGLVAKVIILQASMPPAIFNFVLAEKYNQDSKTVASIILAGTIISIITTPIILSFLID
ncbi:MAG: AEC family transporter [Thermodesulfobacteriota bacterium]